MKKSGICSGVACLIVLSAAWSSAQETGTDDSTDQTNEQAVQLPEIPDEPKTVDPTKLLPPELAAKASVELTDSSLREVIQWLQEDRGIVVLLDNNALAAIGVSPAEPVSDRLQNEPIYLLLNRLRALELAWYFENDILHITSVEVAEERTTTATFNVGDLLDEGYEMDSLLEAIENAVYPQTWENVGGNGVLNAIGDVLFARQTDEVHRQILGLLTALREHGRQTFVNDPEQHLRIRQRLSENISVNFEDQPLSSTIGEISRIAEVDIRLDLPALRGMRVREREPVTLSLQNRKLQTVLQAIVLDLELTWMLRDGVLWITSPGEAENLLKLAVYDVRDLCRDEAETYALMEALESQTDPESWEAVGGPGTMSPVKPGTIVVNHEERVHAEMLALLETYRTALRSSKFRESEQQDPNRIETVYYRTHANVARDLYSYLPRLVRPDTWKSDDNPDAKGEIILISSTPDLAVDKGTQLAVSEEGALSTLLIDRSVLIVRQTPAVHEEIGKVLRRVEFGDPQNAGGGFGGGGFGGGGSFGGGFFNITSRLDSAPAEGLPTRTRSRR